MIRIAICDDEKNILDELLIYINKYVEKKNIADIETFCFSSASLLLSALEDKKFFDIFILDVYIGDEMGTTLSRNIRKLGIESPIIFITTSLEHAPQSYEVGTLRYLIKPINLVKFYEALDVAIEKAEKIGRRQIKLKTENGLEIINASNIMCSEAYEHYQYISLNDETQMKVRSTVTELFTILNKHGGFLRVGSSYIINLRHVKNVSRTDVLLYNNKKIQIPRGKHVEIKNAFWDYQYETQEE